jgi:hypothetical protein
VIVIQVMNVKLNGVFDSGSAFGSLAEVLFVLAVAPTMTKVRRSTTPTPWTLRADLYWPAVGTNSGPRLRIDLR